MSVGEICGLRECVGKVLVFRRITSLRQDNPFLALCVRKTKYRDT